MVDRPEARTSCHRRDPGGHLVRRHGRIASKRLDPLANAIDCLPQPCQCGAVIRRRVSTAAAASPSLTDGHPEQEDALIYRFRAIGIGGREPFDLARLDPETRAGIAAGFEDAMKIIIASRAQLGMPTGTGWSRVEKARYGFNYLSRATINYVGLGANVDAENLSFNTFVDGAGASLDGAKADYAFTLKPPPPVNAFWSVTLYDARTLALYPNGLSRYLINDRTPGLKVEPDGAVRLQIQRARPKSAANWLPAPDGPFYLVVRSYLPKPEMISGGWRPEPVAATPHPAPR